MKTKKAKRESRKPLKIQIAVAEFFANAAKRAGWAVETFVGASSPIDWYESPYDGSSNVVCVRCEKTVDGVAIRIWMDVDRFRRFTSVWNGCSTEGQTMFDGRCFTRRGIDGGSCWLDSTGERKYEHVYPTVEALLEGETKRCVDASKRAKTAEKVPGLEGFSRQPEWFDEAKKKLEAGRTVDLYPHGMGIGYALSKRGGRFGAYLNSKRNSASRRSTLSSSTATKER